MRRFLASLCLVTCGTLCTPRTVSAEIAPAFDIDVEAVLAKAGCNGGDCHGNQNGKGGFRLSLRGQDPDFDHQAIVALSGGRRIDLLDPSQSLLLKKPTLELAHQGGKRFAKDTKPYQLMRDWIAAGAPKPLGSANRVVELRVTPREAICFAPEASLSLAVEAIFENGSRRDVTDLAVYEASNLNVSISADGLVQRASLGESTVVVRYLNQQVPVSVAFLPTRADFQWQAGEASNYIDEHIFAKLKQFRRNPTTRCEDHVFLRRIYLDALGLLPTADEARAFTSSTNPQKRDELIDAVLARPEFADHWALKWADLLRAEEKVLDPRGVAVFHDWIRDSLASGKPLNEFVAELLVARGSTYDNPPTNYFRALRKTNERGEAAARVFLGTRLQCAQCHNHPFDRWTQDDYYAWAALFARIDYKIIENKPDDKLDKNQFKGEQLVQVKAEGEVQNPTTGETMRPRFLGEQQAIASESARLRELASWLTAPDNRQFARSQVNRLWYHLLGTGLVDPVDDFRITNPASHPELLEKLTDDFISSGFDIRHILRSIMQSATYQLSAAEEGTAFAKYASVAVRRLSSEQLLDGQSRALGAAVKFNGHELGMRAVQLPGVHKVRFRAQAPSAADRFLFAFGKPERLMTCECERSDATTLAQALLLVNGECMDDLLTTESNVIGNMLANGRDLETIIRELYWAALSRAPKVAELHHSYSVIAASPSKRAGLEDVAWALLNAKEFVFRQ